MTYKDKQTQGDMIWYFQAKIDRLLDELYEEDELYAEKIMFSLLEGE